MKHDKLGRQDGTQGEKHGDRKGKQDTSHGQIHQTHREGHRGQIHKENLSVQETNME